MTINNSIGSNEFILDKLLVNVIEELNPILNETFDALIKKKCYKYIGDTTFEEFVATIFEESLYENVSYTQYVKEFYRVSFNKVQTTKKRWLSTAHAKLDAELVTLKDKIELLSIDSVVEEQRQTLDNWGNDSLSLLCQFPGFDKLTPKRMYSAFYSDISYSISLVLHTKYSTTQISPVVESLAKQELVVEEDTKTRSSLWYDMPVGAEKASKMSLKPMLKEDYNDYASLESTRYSEYSDFNYAKDRRVRTLVRELDLYRHLPNEQMETLLIKEFKTLDVTDLDILSYICQKAHIVDFIQKGTTMVRLDILELLEYLGYSSVGSKNYHMIRSRLSKISSYRFQDIQNIDGKDVVVRSFGTFDLSYEKDENGNYDLCSPVVFLSHDLLQSYMQGKTISVPRHQLDALKMPLSNLLFFPLHKTRLDLFFTKLSQGGDVRELVFDANYGYFASKVRFTSVKRIKGQIDLVCSALKELQSNDLLISDFEVLPRYSIRITFKPLSEIERQKVVDISPIAAIPC